MNIADSESPVLWSKEQLSKAIGKSMSWIDNVAIPNGLPFIFLGRSKRFFPDKALKHLAQMGTKEMKEEGK